MPDDRQLAGLIGQTYDAAMGDDDWGRVLDRLLALFDARTGLLARSFVPMHDLVTIGIDEACIPQYRAHYQQLDPIRPMMPAPDGSVFTNFMLVPEAAYMRSEFYSEMLAPRDMHAGLFWMDPAGSDRTDTLSMWRPRSRPGWDEAQVRALRAIAPHLRRAMGIERRIAGAAARRTAVRLARGPSPLTRRERECLARVARGVSSKGIARELELSTYTINEYVESAMRKLRAASRTEAVATAMVLGLLDA